MAPTCYVYYCSGHGFGHATRVSAFTCQLLSLPERDRPFVHIVSSAPKHVFSDSIALGARYRYADWIDPVIVQPLAYRVDRQKSVEVLKAFLKNKDTFLETEREWLIGVKARCVLSDAAFLGCLAAKAAGIPSILVTNFTFDSVYSYLATNFIDEQHAAQPDGTPFLAPDAPIQHSLLEPFVSQIHAGYRSADLLLLLPGHIPMPSFPTQLSLPATTWIDCQENSFLPEVMEYLERLKENPSKFVLHDHIPFPPDTALSQKSASFTRRILPMPLLVRSPSSSIECSPYTSEGRARVLKSANVPPELYDPDTTRILVVSFGGQVLKWPGRKKPSTTSIQTGKQDVSSITPKIGLGISLNGDKKARPSRLDIPPHISPSMLSVLEDHRDIDPNPTLSPRITTASHIWIPGAPPVVNPLSTPLISSPRGNRDESSANRSTSILGERIEEKENESLSVTYTPGHTPSRVDAGGTFSPLMDILNLPGSPSRVVSETTHQCRALPDETIDEMDTRLRGVRLEGDGVEADVDLGLPQLLPDSSWIAIVCGASDEQRQNTCDLPENFYLAPKDVYMPNLTAIADVLLGKLGYGTVAECIDSLTPMVYVSRPLFIEELGLRLLLEKEGVCVEMSRTDYEGGRWAERVQEAWERARVAKEWKRKVEEGDKRDGTGGFSDRDTEIRKMAKVVVDWVEDCWKDV